MSSSNVCRPHFHTPLHPWLTETKPLSHSTSWVPFGQSDPEKSQSPGSQPSSQTHNLFSFPPTPPKDSTPDSVIPTSNGTNGTNEYQSAVAHAMGVFMHHPADNHNGTSSGTNGSGNGGTCSMDIKPSTNLLNSQQNGVKQREGTASSSSSLHHQYDRNNLDGMFGSASATNGSGSVFDNQGGAATSNYGSSYVGHHHSLHNGGIYSSSNSMKHEMKHEMKHSLSAPNSAGSPNNKSRNKSRTSAGKPYEFFLFSFLYCF